MITMEELRERVERAPKVTLSRNRFGYNIGGKRLRRVTTLLRGIPKDALPNWAAKMVAEYAHGHQDEWRSKNKREALKLLKGAPWRYRDSRGDRGSAVHNAIEAWMRGDALPADLNDDELECAKRAVDFMVDRDSRVLGAEISVLNFSMGYAGTFDLWEVDRNGVGWLLDWKTSKGIYPNQAVQQAAYLHAEKAIVQAKAITGKGEKWEGRMIDWGPECADRLGLVHVTPDDAVLHAIREGQMTHLWRIFRASAFTKQWLDDTDQLRGPPRVATFDEPVSTILTRETR